MKRSAIPTFDFQYAAASQFSDRPTLRQVTSEQLWTVLQEKLPWLAFVTPALSDADPLMLDSPDPDTPYWTTQPLVDRVLQALLEVQPLDVEPVGKRHHNLGLTSSYRFAGSNSAFDTRQLSGLSDALDELVQRLPRLFCEAQLKYWSDKGSAGVSRDQWLQLLLKTTLLRGLPLQGLDVQEQACIRGLIRGGAAQPSVYFVKASLTCGAMQYDQMLSHLLVTGDYDERQVVLWCAPSGVTRSFASLIDFGKALRNELARHYSFQSLSWTRQPVEGNVFAQQVSLLLESMFLAFDHMRFSGLADVASLEQRFAELSDPAAWFVRYEDDTPATVAPPGLRASAPQDSFACRAALLQLALDQLDAGGVSVLDGIQSLTAYTAQQLTEQIKREHGDEISPDHVLLDLYIARGVPGGAATGAGGGEPLAFVGTKSLTEFAIGNLASLKGAYIKQVRHQKSIKLPKWLNADAAKRLITQVDIGGRYPAYVAGQLDDQARRAERVELLGREWRSAFLSSAISARLDAKVSEVGLQCVVDFCAGHQDPLVPRMSLIPLAFRRSRRSRKKDTVRGMYLLFCAEPAKVLLYRPLYRQDTVREYASLKVLLAHIRESTLLQESILDWIDPAARDVYAEGGFSEPHIVSIGSDPYALPDRPKPAVLDLKLWLTKVDEKIYQANRDLLVELAGLESVSNAESRWQLLCEGAWLLFDVVTQAIRGPVASVAWLVQFLASLQHDLAALEQGGEFERSAAVADLLLNLGMTLLHAHQPKQETVPTRRLPEVSLFEGPDRQDGAFTELAIEAREEPEGKLGELSSQVLDFSWRGQHGFNWLPAQQRQKLQAMRSSVSVNGLSPLTAGDGEGLYQIDKNYYAAMAGDLYSVELLAEGVRVVDATGGYGPWLAFVDGAWRVDTKLRLAGGAPDSKTSVSRRFDKLYEKVSKLDEDVPALKAKVQAVTQQMMALHKSLVTMETLKAKAQSEVASAPAGTDVSMKESLIAKYAQREIEVKESIAQQREKIVSLLEEAIGKMDEQLKLLITMAEPKYAKSRHNKGLDEILDQHQESARIELIRDCVFVYNELWSLTDYPQLAALQRAIDGKPLAEVGEHYAAFRIKLEHVVEYQDRMLAIRVHLDNLLAESPVDLVIPSNPPGDHRTVGHLIDERPFSTVQMRFHQVQNLADLALHLDAPGNLQTVARYRDELVSMALRNAAEAHGELDFANLSADDRITILQEAWDEYSAALLNSARILDEGGVLIEPAMLERYRNHLKQLKEDAGQRLVVAVSEQEGEKVVQKRTPYKVSTKEQKVVRNLAGQLMIGVERTIGEHQIVEVHEFFSEKVLATLDLVDGEWRQRESKRPSLVEEATPTDLPKWVKALLDESGSVRTRAEDFIKSSIKGALLEELFDRHLGKLNQALSVVRGGGNDELVTMLERELKDLEADKKQQMTNLYTRTIYPSAEALQHLHKEKLIQVEYVNRRTMRDRSAFDEYRILSLPSKKNLWVAHFHLNSPKANADEFTAGHLKTWEQRFWSSKVAAASGQRVHRGKLTLDQARGIIPFR
ncbi:dermonecrotic toxin domain-containing protein [Pseudomonas asiatica]|uniref:dermonecrotic toxin domain-containing protein n=1 Tax=Pseudomonas asiatica TaxID=2219225 RepID=UPI0037C5DF4B